MNFYVPIFSCYQIPQLIFDFKKVTISPERMTLLLEKKTILEKSFFHTNECKCMSLNVKIELLI